MRKLVFNVYRWVVKLATCLHLPSDKVLHFICAFVMAITFSLIMNKCLAMFLCFAIFVAKEVYDCHKPIPTGWSWGDLIADVIGMVVGFALHYLITI